MPTATQMTTRQHLQREPLAALAQLKLILDAMHRCRFDAFEACVNGDHGKD